ncbi:MAG TPA: beta-galactosidase [Terriglobia bacterium]|nr:beta-galactosidase [Terriglobia bacterium]
MARRTLISAVIFILLSSATARAQKPAMDTVLYGASYYHEYMPYDRLEQDVELMQKAGITVVRLGESTWSSWEPREGEFKFAWMERIINRLHQAGIKVILGTPTYSIPPWLYRKHPEILVTKLGGEKEFYGPRQNMDITHPTYLYYAERVIRQVVSHFKDHPAVIGYQIDNETSSNDTAGRNVQLSFVDYLKKKFGSTQRLNELWGLVYWGQLVNDWDELPPRDGILNPGYKLEWERYQQKITTDFLAWQAAIVSEYKRPDQFITHNFVGGVRTEINEYEIAKHLDIAAVNPYHAVQDQLRPWGTSLSGDLVRSLKRNNYLITETNAQTIGWDSKGQFPPYDGQLRLNVYSHVANGANMVAYWHWHSLHYGQETYWKGVLSHDLEPNRAYNEVSRIAHELKKVGPRLVNFQRKNKAAILYSIDSYQGIRFMPFADDVDYMTVLHQFHRTFELLKVGVDFVFPESNNFADYDVIVVPPLYVATDALLERLVEFVKGGGHLVMSFKSGFCNEYSTVRWTRLPGPLREAAGFSYQEFSNLRHPLALKGDPFGAGDKNQVSAWAEMLMPESAKVLASYDHPFFGKFAAITRNNYGKGTLTYEGTFLSDELQKRVLFGELQQARLTGPDQELPEAVTVRHGTGNSGKTLHFYLNYSSDAQKFAYSYGDGVEMLSEGSVRKGQTLTLAPWDVAIIEER